MVRSLFKRGVSVVAGALVFAAFSTTAFAAQEYFGHISEFVDDGAQGEFYFELTQCDGEVHKFEFRPHSRRDVWRRSINRYMDNDDLVRLRADDNFFVNAMQNVGGGTCVHLPLLLEALGEMDDTETDEDDTVEEIEEMVEFEEEILEVYDRETPPGHVLTPPPFEDKPHMHKKELMRRAKDPISQQHRNQLKNHAEDHLRHELRERLMEGDLSAEELEEFKMKIKKRAHIERRDRHAESLSEEVGFEHANLIQIRELADEDVNEAKQVKVKGFYIEKNGRHLLLNVKREMVAYLHIEGEDYADLEGKRVLVDGMSYRTRKKIDVKSMVALPDNAEFDNSPEDKWRMGTSFFRDVDTTDRSIWFTQYADRAYDKGVFTGYADGRGGFEDPVTIAEIAKIVSVAADHEMDLDADFSELTDEQKAHWAKKFLRHVKRYDCIEDISNPNRPATRKEVVRAVLCAFEMEDFEEAGLPSFPDSNDRFVRKAKALGLVGGYPDGTFRPEGQINRAEMLKIISLAMEMLSEDDGTNETIEELYDEVEDLLDDDEALEEWLDGDDDMEDDMDEDDDSEEEGDDQDE